MQIAGPPSFLRPEATKQTKVYRPHLMPRAPAATHDASQAGRTRGEDYNIARLAPPLKGERHNADAGKSVLTGSAKRDLGDKAPAAQALYSSDALVRCQRLLNVLPLVHAPWMPAPPCSCFGRVKRL